MFGFVQGMIPGHPLAGSGSARRASGPAVCLRPSDLRWPAGARLDKPVVWAVDFLDGDTSPGEPQLWLSRPRGKTASGRWPHQGTSEPNQRSVIGAGFDRHGMVMHGESLGELAVAGTDAEPKRESVRMIFLTTY